MPMCLIVGCSRKSGGARGIRLCRVPAVVTNQGPEVEELSTERRQQWISAIRRNDLTQNIEGKAKTTGRIATTGTFTEATEIKGAWSPHCRLCF